MLFTELSEAVQQRMFQSYLETLDWEDWSETTIDNLQDELCDLLGSDDIKIEYSGFYNQGDGASFTGSIHIETFIKFVSDAGEDEYPLLLYIIKNNDLYDDYVNVYRTNNHYYHNRSIKVGDISLTRDAYDIEHLADDEMENLIQEMQDWVEEKSTEIFNTLRSEYESISSFEYFKQNEIDMATQYDEEGYPLD